VAEAQDSTWARYADSTLGWTLISSGVSVGITPPGGEDYEFRFPYASAFVQDDFKVRSSVGGRSKLLAERNRSTRFQSALPTFVSACSASIAPESFIAVVPLKAGATAMC
jgi:hypothetical protein